MEVIIEVIIETLFVWLISYPIALIRWGVTGFRKGKLDYYLQADPYISFMYAILVGLIIYALISLVIWF